MTKRVVVITGANGFLGSALCRRFAEAGWDVRAGCRSSKWSLPPAEDIVPFTCNLPTELDTAALKGAEALIHAAYVTRYTTLSEAKKTNIVGTMKILKAAREEGVKQFVFISSCSAHDKALGFYGRSKHYLESKLDPSRDLWFRPGLILGHGGLFARMTKTIRSSKIVPLFDHGRQELQTVHIEDLTEAIYRAVDERLTGMYVVAHPESISMRDFLKAVATRLGHNSKFVSVPSKLALGLLRFLEKYNMRISLTSENLQGLRSMCYQDPRASLATLRLNPRSTIESLDHLFSQDFVPGKSLTKSGRKAIVQRE